MKRRALLLSLSALPARAFGKAPATPELPRIAAVPGGVARVELGAAAEAPLAWLDERRVLVTRAASGWVALLGIGLDVEPGGTLVVRVLQAGAERALAVRIAPKQYALQQLTVAPRHVQLAPEDLARHERERAHLQGVLRTFSEASPATLRLRTPVPGRRSASFGLRRVFNGEARSPHNGMDIAAPTGTPVVSSAAGKVIDHGDYFFSGRTMIVDHGHGFLTLYCHLDEIRSEVGRRLAAGDVLGTVGATGRVTGPHLHFSVYLNAAAVDPALFLPPVESG
jgi:murein DD-endopeptidase MepM/ murein hydrolase activator NlpD